MDSASDSSSDMGVMVIEGPRPAAAAAMEAMEAPEDGMSFITDEFALGY